MGQQGAGVICLTVRCYAQRDSAVDVIELSEFLNSTAGPDQWLATQEWLFRSPPAVFRPGFMSVPVVTPVGAAARVHASSGGRTRLVGAERVEGAHLRQWRWVAYQVRPNAGVHGAFPWEQAGEGETARG